MDGGIKASVREGVGRERGVWRRFITHAAWIRQLDSAYLEFK